MKWALVEMMGSQVVALQAVVVGNLLVIVAAVVAVPVALRVAKRTRMMVTTVPAV